MTFERASLAIGILGAGLLVSGCNGRVHQAASTADDGTIAAPVRFDAYRIFLRPVTLAGDTLLLFTDTGGGVNVVRPSVVGVSTRTASLPAFRAGEGVPIPAGSKPPVMEVTDERSMASTAKMWPGTATWSGVLGGAWFADGMWTFDYLHGRLLLHPASAALVASGPHVIPFAFKAVGGTRPTNFARLRVQIDGDSLDLLFDTGATTTLTDSARRVIGDGLPRERATSFMAASVFDRWRRRHAEWRFIERAEFYSTRDMIEVPAISVAGFSVGPVWFTRRLDDEFLPYVGAGTDRPVIGALGGSAYKYFIITVDYKRGLAEFARGP